MHQSDLESAGIKDYITEEGIKQERRRHEKLYNKIARQSLPEAGPWDIA